MSPFPPLCVELGAQRRRILHFALRHLGKPYRYGARPSEAPRVFDCSSFVQYLYQRIGVKLPRTSIEQARCGKVVLSYPIKLSSSESALGGRVERPSRRSSLRSERSKRVGVADLLSGDLLFFTGSEGRYDEGFPQGIGHVVMYAGHGMVVHASFQKGKVVQEPASPWLRRHDLVVIKRILSP